MAESWTRRAPFLDDRCDRGIERRPVRTEESLNVYRIRLRKNLDMKVKLFILRERHNTCCFSNARRPPEEYRPIRRDDRKDGRNVLDRYGPNAVADCLRHG